MASVVDEILQREAEKESKFLPITVEKGIDLELDLGNLLAIDPNPLSAPKLKSKEKEEYLKNLARDNAQLLLNSIYKLPTKFEEDVLYVKLPKGTTPLPRSLPIPTPKPETRWSLFAKEKGIRPRKRDRLVWDEVSQEWRPRYGYKSINDEKRHWLLEVPENKPDDTDMFGDMKNEKKERVARNELNRLHNIARSNNIRIPKSVLAPTKTETRETLSQAVGVAQRSSASMGKFDEKVKDESKIRVKGPKRKFNDNFASLKDEARKNLKILDQLKMKTPKIDVARATDRQVRADEAEEREERRRNRGKPKRGKKSSKYMGQYGTRRSAVGKQPSKRLGRKMKKK